MPMIRYGRTSSRYIERGVNNSTSYARIWSSYINNELPPVVMLHGFADATSASQFLDTVCRSPSDISGFPIDAILATGRTIFVPFMNNGWGLATVGGAPGTNAIDNMITVATSYGIDTTTIDVIGGSMGACNAINWCYRNPTKVNKIILYVPAISLGPIYDLGDSIQDSMNAAYGVADKTSFMTASLSYDPIRMDLTNIASKITVIAATNDPLVSYGDVATLCTTYSIPLITTATGHFSLNDSNVNEIRLLQHLSN